MSILDRVRMVFFVDLLSIVLFDREIPRIGVFVAVCEPLKEGELRAEGLLLRGALPGCEPIPNPIWHFSCSALWSTISPTEESALVPTTERGRCSGEVVVDKIAKISLSGSTTHRPWSYFRGERGIPSACRNWERRFNQQPVRTISAVDLRYLSPVQRYRACRVPKGPSHKIFALSRWLDATSSCR